MTEESFDLFDRLGRTELGLDLLARMEAPARARDGAAQQRHWDCEDGWMVTYTTSRVQGGPHHGKFVVQVHKPTGPGARSGKATRLVETYRRQFSTRKAAKRRATVLYAKHSPKWAARHADYLASL